jgi:DNA polymerase III delta prime subunit
MTNLERWHIYCQDIESDEQFITWAFYATISGALQRRVCLDQIPHISTGRPIFGNIYVIFIGPPGMGKSAAGNVAVELFESFGGFEGIEQHHKRIIKIAPSSITTEQMYRYLNNNYTIYTLPAGHDKHLDKAGKEIKRYLSTPMSFFAVEELGSLFRENTGDLVKFVCQGYDGKDFHRETKTQGVDFIKSICLMIFGCATPDWIEEVSKNGLLKQGFTARTIFIWSDSKRFFRTFWRFDRPEQLQAWKELQEHIRNLTKLYGPVQYTDEARNWIIKWYEGGGCNPINKAKVLADYYPRKKVHLFKMSMLVHYADSCTDIITLPEVMKALDLLETAETSMHRALMGSAVDNPAAKVASIIEDKLINGARIPGSDVLSETHWISEGKLLLEGWDHCTNGRATFDDAIKYLMDTGKITTSIQAGRPAYRALRKQV